jgi:hypothetical protein
MPKCPDKDAGFIESPFTRNTWHYFKPFSLPVAISPALPCPGVAIDKVDGALSHAKICGAA